MCRTGGRRCPGSGGRGRSGGPSASSAGGQASAAPSQKSRRVDGKPETEADKRFFDLRESGYRGPIDQDGNIPPDGHIAHDVLAAMAKL
jgi:hypothetical protein